MKKKLIALCLAAVLTFSMSVTALAAGTSTSLGQNKSTGQTKPTPGQNKSTGQTKPTPDQPVSSSESSTVQTPDRGSGRVSRSSSSESPAPAKKAQTTIETAKPGGKVEANTVKVAIVGADGKVSSVSLNIVIREAKTTVTAAAATSAAQAVTAVQALMTTAPTPFFAKTVEALATMKGSAMVVNDCGTVKTAAVAADVFGNNIASAGVVKNVTTGALVMLMSVNADGKVEYVEGVVDPVTGAVLGAFKGVPKAITVLVFA